MKIRQDAGCLKSIFVEWRGLQTSRYSHGSFYIDDSMKQVDAFSFCSFTLYHVRLCNKKSTSKLGFGISAILRLREDDDLTNDLTSLTSTLCAA